MSEAEEKLLVILKQVMEEKLTSINVEVGTPVVCTKVTAPTLASVVGLEFYPYLVKVIKVGIKTDTARASASQSAHTQCAAAFVIL